MVTDHPSYFSITLAEDRLDLCMMPGKITRQIKQLKADDRVIERHYARSDPPRACMIPVCAWGIGSDHNP